MPFVSGRLLPGGAVVDVLVGVSAQRRLLRKHGFPVPVDVHCRAMIDTGSNLSGFAPRIFSGLDITPVGRQAVLTPSTRYDQPHPSDVFDVALSLVADGGAHPFPDCRVMLADCWLPGEGFEALIGRDILDRCFFQYMGLDRAFTLAF